MSLAPEGREGLFTALASAPLFAAKLPTGAGPAPAAPAFDPCAVACLLRVKCSPGPIKTLSSQSRHASEIRRACYDAVGTA